MAGSMKEIKLRIRSVQSTMQITKAMELVASSKLRRAKERAESCRPYFETLQATLTHIAAGDTDFESPYLRRSAGDRRLYIVIGGDRGLAGGYNSNLLKAVEADAAGCEQTVLPIGKRVAEYFQHRGVPVLTQDFAAAGELSVSDSFEIARLVCGQFTAGGLDDARLVYTQSASMLTQTPDVLSVLPLARPPKAKADRQSGPPACLMLYEPDSASVFDAIVPEYLAGLVYGALCESVASEQGARRTAMDAATKNAGEMIENLNLYYNRARQAAITQEITEIVAGADAGA